MGGLSTYAYVASSPLGWFDPGGLDRKNVNLGHGWSGGIDIVPGSDAQFEIHVFDPKGKEVGMFGEKGWFAKHGHEGRPPNCPLDVENQLKGQAVDILRRAGKIGRKGTENIKGGRWLKGGGATLGALGAASGVLHLFTLPACMNGTTAQCFCALEAEESGGDPSVCMKPPPYCPKCAI